MTITINQLSNGQGLIIDGEIYLVVEYQHVKPGKGSAFARVKMKNVKTDAVLERTYRTADRLEDILLEEHRMQFQYRSGDMFHFMNLGNFEQIEVPEGTVGDAARFLLENLEVIGLVYENRTLRIVLPNFIEAEITYAEPGIKGDSSRSGTKPVQIETGTTVQVPLFINQGDWIRIDTRGGQYVERIQK